ncbi:MAG: GspH/FimT family protein [FCB group bacterium]|nr:GspH/FimT family protein [FCB group bacterium]
MIIAIIGIITVIALPKLGLVIDDVSEKAVSDRLIEDLSLLRGMAMSQHDTTWLVVNQTENQYSLWVGPYASRVLIPDPDTGDSHVLDLDSAYAGMTISSVNFGGSSEVSFNWWGTPSSGGTIVINGTRTITVVAETGMAYE